MNFSLSTFQLQFSETLALTVAWLNGRPNESFKKIMSYLSPSVIAFKCRYTAVARPILDSYTGQDLD